MAKRSFMGVYERPDRQYDPTVAGYGHAAEWRKAFRQRMSLDEAREVLGGISGKVAKLLALLGLAAPVTWQEIKSGYRATARKCHPDANGSTEAAVAEMKKVNAAYTLLEEMYGK